MLKEKISMKKFLILLGFVFALTVFASCESKETKERKAAEAAEQARLAQEAIDRKEALTPRLVTAALLYAKLYIALEKAEEVYMRGKSRQLFDIFDWSEGYETSDANDLYNFKKDYCEVAWNEFIKWTVAKDERTTKSLGKNFVKESEMGKGKKNAPEEEVQIVTDVSSYESILGEIAATEEVETWTDVSNHAVCKVLYKERGYKTITTLGKAFIAFRNAWQREPFIKDIKYSEWRRVETETGYAYEATLVDYNRTMVITVVLLIDGGKNFRVGVY
jgi:hypothetical protein